jgi:peptidoglycan hydrolase CwlO-like protein
MAQGTSSGKGLSVFLLVLLILACGVAGFFAYYYIQSQSTNQSNLSQIQSALGASNSNVSMILGSIMSAKSTMASDNAKITNYTNQISSLQAQIANDSKQIANDSNQITALQSQLSSVGTQSSSAQSQIQSLQTQVSNLQDQVNTDANTISNLQSQVSSLQSQNQNLQSQISSDANQISSLNGQVSSLSSQLAAANAIVEMQDSQILLSNYVAQIASGSGGLAWNYQFTNAGYILISYSATNKVNYQFSADNVVMTTSPSTSGSNIIFPIAPNQNYQVALVNDNCGVLGCGSVSVTETITYIY